MATETDPHALTLTHSPAEGTRLHGAGRDGGVAAVLRAAGEPVDGPGGWPIRATWVWARNAGVWWLRGTRNTAQPGIELERTREALEAAGYRVTGPTPPPAAQPGRGLMADAAPEPAAPACSCRAGGPLDHDRVTARGSRCWCSCHFPNLPTPPPRPAPKASAT